MRKIFLSLFFITLIAMQCPMVFAADKKEQSATDKISDAAKDVAADIQAEVDNAKEKLATDDKENKSSLMADIQKARDTIMNGTGGNSFARGMIIALLQPIFIASMFCLGLWSGMMSEKLKHIWVLPVIMYVATVIGAFITTYHPEWKPDFASEHLHSLNRLQSTEVVAVVIGVFIGIAVALQFVLPAFFAMILAVAIGLILGFSQTSEIGKHHDLMPFWAGFGLTGLLVNIFGIGFETFFQSINLRLITRLVGVATAVLSVYVGAKLL